MTLYLDTLRALAAPRRAVPIAVVVLAMLYAQHRVESVSALRPIPEDLPALVMAAVFLLVAPFAWRALFPRHREVSYRGLRLLLFVALAALPSLAGWAVGDALDLGYTYVTYHFHLPVTATLFLAGGWGLARDIDLERGEARARARAEALEREAERATLLAMRAHLDPHFLFNTLNAIAEWTREDPATAERAIVALSDLLRDVLGGIKAAAWPLARELELARDLLALHRMRDPTWFTVAWSGEAAVDVPPLVLLPVVENAVKHGPAKGHRGEISITVHRLEPGAEVIVENPGAYGGPRDGGEGLDTVRRRLALAYRGGEVEIAGVGNRTRVTLVLPGDTPDEVT